MNAFLLTRSLVLLVFTRCRSFSSHPRSLSSPATASSFCELAVRGGASSSSSAAAASASSSLTKDATNRFVVAVNDGVDVKLEALSYDPILFRSVEPVLSKRECRVLSGWLASKSTREGSDPDADPDAETLRRGLETNEEGAILLRRAQKILSRVLALDDDVVVMPRHLVYVRDNHSRDADDEYDFLAGGLHVDVNNGMHFRHWTALLYLDSCDDCSGSTTFPLAAPLLTSSRRTNDEDEDSERLRRVARSLVEEHVSHTRGVGATEDQRIRGAALERAAVALARGDPTTLGARVAPRRGTFCLFSGLGRDGWASEASFHGGEALGRPSSTSNSNDDGGNNNKKEVLSFFFEVPRNGIASREDMGRAVAARERAFLRRIRGDDDE